MATPIDTYEKYKTGAPLCISIYSGLQFLHDARLHFMGTLSRGMHDPWNNTPIDRMPENRFRSRATSIPSTSLNIDGGRRRAATASRVGTRKQGRETTRSGDGCSGESGKSAGELPGNDDNPAGGEGGRWEMCIVSCHEGKTRMVQYVIPARSAPVDGRSLLSRDRAAYAGHALSIRGSPEDGSE